MSNASGRQDGSGGFGTAGRHGIQSWLSGRRGRPLGALWPWCFLLRVACVHSTPLSSNTHIHTHPHYDHFSAHSALGCSKVHRKERIEGSGGVTVVWVIWVPVSEVRGRVVFPTPPLVLPFSRCHLRLLISSQVAAEKTSLIKSNLRQALSFSRHCSVGSCSQLSLFPLFVPADLADTSGDFTTILDIWIFSVCVSFPALLDQ